MRSAQLRLVCAQAPAADISTSHGAAEVVNIPDISYLSSNWQCVVFVLSYACLTTNHLKDPV